MYVIISVQFGATDPTEHAGAGTTAVQSQRAWSGVTISAFSAFQHPAGIGHGSTSIDGFAGRQVCLSFAWTLSLVFVNIVLVFCYVGDFSPAYTWLSTKIGSTRC